MSINGIELKTNDFGDNLSPLNILEKELYETSGLSELAKQLNEHQDKIKTILSFVEDCYIFVPQRVRFIN